MNLCTIIVPVLVSAVLTALMVPMVIRLSYKKKLFDKVNERKVHKGVVPRLGGGAFILSIMAAVAVAVVMSHPRDMHCLLSSTDAMVSYAGVIGAALIIYLVGVWDDIQSLNYKYKFLSQLISALLIVYVGGFWVNDLAGLLGVNALPAAVGKPFSVLLIMFIINAFNLIDGIDGLAATLGFIATVTLGILFAIGNQNIMAVVSLVMAASLAVFFCYNKFGSTKNHTKIFMGDGGSQTMGLIIAFLVVYMIMRGEHEVSEVVQVSFIAAFSLIIIPCFDALRVMFARMAKGKNPFLPDKTHIHHKFLRIGYGPSVTLLAITGIALGFIALNILIMVSGIAIGAVAKINMIIVLDIMLWVLLHAWLNSCVKKAEAKGLK